MVREQGEELSGLLYALLHILSSEVTSSVSLQSAGVCQGLQRYTWEECVNSRWCDLKVCVGYLSETFWAGTPSFPGDQVKTALQTFHQLTKLFPFCVFAQLLLYRECHCPKYHNGLFSPEGSLLGSLSNILIIISFLGVFSFELFCQSFSVNTCDYLLWLFNAVNRDGPSKIRSVKENTYSSLLSKQIKNIFRNLLQVRGHFKRAMSEL